MNCHKEDSKVMMESLKVDFQEFLQMVTDKCVLPEFEE
jgi:hypothetical protein